MRALLDRAKTGRPKSIFEQFFTTFLQLLNIAADYLPTYLGSFPRPKTFLASKRAQISYKLKQRKPVRFLQQPACRDKKSAQTKLIVQQAREYMQLADQPSLPCQNHVETY